MRRSVFFVTILSILTIALTGCFRPASFKAVARPRDGQALNRRICVDYSANYQIDMAGLERLHPFDINKYAKIYHHLVTDGLIKPSDVYVPVELTRKQMLLVHSPEYLTALGRSDSIAEYLEFGPAKLLPVSITDGAILRAFRYASGGTILAARLALRHGMAVNLGGGYHHAEPDRGGGFCIYADMPIALRILQREGLIQRALVVDLDVHQGNGTALCIAEDENVFTFDLHQEGIYPIPKEHNDLDVPMPAGTDDEAFLAELKSHLDDVFEQAKPDIVVYQSGVDSLADDPLADFELTEDCILERDRLVFAAAAERKVPIVMVLGGGYSENAWRAQYRSIASLTRRYGLAPGETPRPRRRRRRRSCTRNRRRLLPLPHKERAGVRITMSRIPIGPLTRKSPLVI